MSQFFTPGTTGGSGSGDVTAASNITDDSIVRGDGGAKGIQGSVGSLTDAGIMTLPAGGLTGTPTAGYFFIDNGTGFYESATDNIRCRIGGVDSWNFSGGALTGFNTGDPQIANGANIAYRFQGDNDTGMARTGANALALYTGNSAALSIDSSQNIAVAGTVDGRDIATDGLLLDATAPGWNGSIVETIDVDVASNGTVITLSVQMDGGGDLTVIFSDGLYAWDTSPAATVTLTAGTDTVPVDNYVYFLQSSKTLTASTSGWPAAEHAAIATVLCQTAASMQTQLPYKVHAWTDHVQGSDMQGHVSDLNFWIRRQSATWESGVSQTYDITTNGGSADNVLLTTDSGNVLQLHPHNFPAFSGTPDIYVVNNNSAPYTVITDINEILEDSAGSSLEGTYFTLVFWGCVSENTNECKLFCNLPSGSYGGANQLRRDQNGYANYSIPSEFRGTGFLISKWNLRQQTASSGTWTSIDEIDLRGLFPSASAGGGGLEYTDFIDSTFRIIDNADNTKELAFEASGITTATTRTITAADQNIDMTPTTGTYQGSDALLTDIAALTLNKGEILVFDGTDIVALTAGTDTYHLVANSAVTEGVEWVAPSGGGITWNEETGTSATMAVNNAYIANNAGLVTLTLPTTAAVGDTIQVVGKGAGGWKIAQNAGETINFDSSATTTGTGGSLASTAQYNAVSLVCITANTVWAVFNSVGTIDIT